MAGTKIGVQPPKRSQAGAYLYPPVLVKQSVRESDPDADYFATAVVVDRHGTVADGYLQGTKAVSRFEIVAAKADAESFVFPFTDLSISHPGTYMVRVDVYKCLPGDVEGAALVEQIETRPISVMNAQVPREGPSAEERSFMRKARDAGVCISST